MASTVKVPLLGAQNKGTVVGVAIGGFAIAGFMIYRYESKQKKQAAAASAAASQSTAYGYGMMYGYGSGTPAGGYYGYGEPGITYGYGAGGGFPAGYYGYGEPLPPSAPGVAATTNAQWAQAAINQLTQDQYDASTVAAALGAYELGQPVTAAQDTIVQAAIGIEGYPPQPGANGYPPSINVQGTTGGGTGGGQGGTGGTGGGSATTVTVPNVVGQRVGAAGNAIRAAGLVYASASGVLNPIHAYVVTSTSPAGGTQAAPGSTVKVSFKRLHP
jgi:PASTA domain